MVRLWASVLVMLLAAILSRGALAGTFQPLSAVGYQNSDGIDYTPCDQVINSQDETAAVDVRDGVWAPHAEGCLFPYFATGTSTHFLDALSLHFDLGGSAPLAGAILRAFMRKGSYEDIASWGASWHQYRLYPGAFATEDEDCDNSCVATYASFPEDRSWADWIEIPVPTEWFDGGTLDVSLRLWNAQVDAVELTGDLPTAAKRATWGQLKMLYR